MGRGHGGVCAADLPGLCFRAAGTVPMNASNAPSPTQPGVSAPSRGAHRSPSHSAWTSAALPPATHGRTVRVSLEAQRTAGHGRIGEWFQTLGFVSEQQVTAALARQWSCPVLRPNSIALGCEHTAEIPITLLESCVMIPLNDVDSTATLHIAFGDSIDYSALYAIERMLGCHTDACLAAPSLVHKSLQV